MPLFAIHCTDRDGALPTRIEQRTHHLAYLTGRSEVRIAGALLGPDDQPTGSLVIVEAETIEAARAIAEGDPFARIGVFASVVVSPWRLAIGYV